MRCRTASSPSRQCRPHGRRYSIYRFRRSIVCRVDKIVSACAFPLHPLLWTGIDIEVTGKDSCSWKSYRTPIWRLARGEYSCEPWNIPPTLDQQRRMAGLFQLLFLKLSGCFDWFRRNTEKPSWANGVNDCLATRFQLPLYCNVKNLPTLRDGCLAT